MMVLHLNCIYYVCIDYVAEIWEDLLGMSKEKRKSVAQKYSAKVPQPLNSQFPDRVEKPEAVGRYEERKEKEVTKLFPPGKAPALCQILIFSSHFSWCNPKVSFFAVIVTRKFVAQEKLWNVTGTLEVYRCIHCYHNDIDSYFSK